MVEHMKANGSEVRLLKKYLKPFKDLTGKFYNTLSMLVYLYDLN